MPRLPPPAALQAALDSLDAAIAGSHASAGTLEVAALARKWAIVDERYPPRILHLYEVAGAAASFALVLQPAEVPPPRGSLPSLVLAVSTGALVIGAAALLARRWRRRVVRRQRGVRFTSSDAPPPEPEAEPSVELEAAAAPASADTTPALREGEIDI